jgi:hypothetical protein
MSREIFVPKKFNAEHQRIIDHAIDLLEDMRAQGFAVTLRSLYYQFVTEECWFPNTIQSYKRFGGIISDARLAGLIDWELLEDRVRTVEKLPSWASPTDIMESAVNQYRENLWAGQDRRVHLRIEKDALIGVIQPVCERWRVPYVACRGNTSQSEAYAAGKLLRAQIDRGLNPLVLYLGDHDPSGIDMTRDNIERLSMFAGEDIEVRRIALNFDQIEEYRLPGNPAKLTDSRAGAYIARFGNESWELDALKPSLMESLIEREIKAAIDLDLWGEAKAAEEHNQRILEAILNRWGEVEELFGNQENDDAN